MSPFEIYIRELRDIRATGAGVKETSYYNALANLFNTIGATLQPKVRCVMQLKNQGAGMPDGGLFTSRQFQKRSGDDPMEPQNPERGVIEIKGTGDDAWVIANTPQVSKYWDKYRQVLVTNYRDFVLIGQNVNGQPIKLETYRLASNEKEFWLKVQNPQAFALEQAEQITEYLKRVMLIQAAIATPQDLAWFLASYAKDAKARIEKSDLPALESIRTGLEEALGITFKEEQGDRFFKSTLIQTLFYGLFSAWVLWHKQGARRGYFDWQTAAWSLHVPMVKALFEKVATPTNLGRLDLVEVLDWTGEALNRVDRTTFFAQFDEGQAVQYFYEPFLEAFDPQLRKDMGVWYTPPEIVQYMVARVDRVLRDELGIADGLADENVYILDPCCGTGAFLVEVLKRINQTICENGEDALSGSTLKEISKHRVFGFEILTAPFVVAHLQLGLLLQNFGVPLQDDSERVGVYLTNALTGWQPPDDEAKRRIQQLSLNFPELQEERDAADSVKRGKPILVVLGNPPYNAYAGVSSGKEEGLVDAYKDGLISEWGIKKFNLDDLYVRFFRVAENCINRAAINRGVVCFISNQSWVSDPSFVVLRKNLYQSFDKFWIENMHGNRKISEYAPDGKTSETVFAIQGFSAGIQQGVAISLWVKNGEQSDMPIVRFRDDINAAKASDRRKQLLSTLEDKNFNSNYQTVFPSKTNRFSFKPSVISAEYLKWIKLTDICAVAPSNGLMEKRGSALIDTDRNTLETRMRAYFDDQLSWEDYKRLGYGLVKPQASFDPKLTRAKVLVSGQFNPERIVRYALRPFETRWCYYTSDSSVWNRSRPSLWNQCWEGNSFLMTRPAGVASPEGCPLFFTRLLGDNDFLRGHAYYFPLRLMNGARLKAKERLTLLEILGEKPEVDLPLANLSDSARAYLKHLGFPNPDEDQETAILIWIHALAIGYSPAYLQQNHDGIQQDFPRIPLPNNRDLLIASANLGKQLAQLLDTETKIEGVTVGKINSELRNIGVISKLGGGKLNPDKELSLTVGWGHAGKEGVTMPGKGKVQEREYSAEELKVLDQSMQTLLGKTTCDVYLNDLAYWKNIPTRVWNYTIGGYQVIKKWLSYREETLLGRSLNVEEVREVSNITRRIAAILFLEEQLDHNYEQIKKANYIASHIEQGA